MKNPLNIRIRQPIALVPFAFLLLFAASAIRSVRESSVYPILVLLLLPSILLLFILQLIASLRRPDKLIRLRAWVWRRRTLYVLLGLVCGAFLITEVFDLVGRQMYVYRISISKAKASTDLQQATGAPIHIGWPIQPEISVSGEDGYAALEIPLSGRRGKGKLYVFGTKTNGSWRINQMFFVQDSSGQKIDLNK